MEYDCCNSITSHSGPLFAYSAIVCCHIPPAVVITNSASQYSACQRLVCAGRCCELALYQTSVASSALSRTLRRPVRLTSPQTTIWKLRTWTRQQKITNLRPRSKKNKWRVKINVLVLSGHFWKVTRSRSSSVSFSFVEIYICNIC